MKLFFGNHARAPSLPIRHSIRGIEAGVRVRGIEGVISATYTNEFERPFARWKSFGAASAMLLPQTTVLSDELMLVDEDKHLVSLYSWAWDSCFLGAVSATTANGGSVGNGARMFDRGHTAQDRETATKVSVHFPYCWKRT